MRVCAPALSTARGNQFTTIQAPGYQRSTARPRRAARHRGRTRHDLASPATRPSSCAASNSRLHVGFDNQIHRGALVVNEALVADVIAIFGELQRQRYPIARMQTVDHYPKADDELSMQDNNTSAFNCRPMPSGTSWSLHAYGRAIDLNPLINRTSPNR